MNIAEKNELLRLARTWVGYKEKRTPDYQYYDMKDDNAGMANFTRFGRIADMCIGAVDRRVKDGHAWCCMFLLACLYEVKNGRVDCTTFKGLIPVNAEALWWVRKVCNDGGQLSYFAGCATWLQSWKRMGMIGKDPAAGDFVVYLTEDGKPYHIGLVYEYAGGEYFTTIEGNTSAVGENVVANGGCVAMKRRKKTQRVVFLKN